MTNRGMDETPPRGQDRRALSYAMTSSVVVGLVMLVLKFGAYLLTGSAAVLSDTAESVVHMAAVSFAAYSLRLSRKPADASHMYGHAKIAFFSAGFEGAIILLVALYIIYESIHKWMTGLRLQHLGLGILLCAIAAVVNGALGVFLIRTGRRNRSLILVANGKHVLTDCWTSAAVVVGLALTVVTGWLPWDPICGIAMAINIVVSGVALIQSASAGLMDKADPTFQRQLAGILDRECRRFNVSYHNLRHRNLGDAQWIDVHLLYPPGTLLGNAHRTATAIEDAIESELEPRAHVTTHLECSGDHKALHPHEMLQSSVDKLSGPDFCCLPGPRPTGNLSTNARDDPSLDGVR